VAGAGSVQLRRLQHLRLLRPSEATATAAEGREAGAGETQDTEPVRGNEVKGKLIAFAIAVEMPGGTWKVVGKDYLKRETAESWRSFVSAAWGKCLTKIVEVPYLDGVRLEESK
jgi:hypothetical protein